MTPSHVVSLAFVAAMMAATPVAAQGPDAQTASPLEDFLHALRLSTTVRLDYFQSSKELDDRENLFGATLQLKALPRFNDRLEGKLELRAADSDFRNWKRGTNQSRLVEGYLTVHFEKADLRIGKQIVAWGRADGVNPTDNLTPRDYVVLLPLDEDQRFGTTALELNTYLSQELTLTTFASTLFEPAKFALPSAGIVTLQPPHTVSNTEVGLKLNKTGGDFDWSVSYFHGYNLLPTLRAEASAPELRYDRINVLGADWARNFGRFGFRTEVAYTRPSDPGGTDPNARNPRVFWIAGVDRTFLENLNVNLQLLLRWMPQYHPPAQISGPTLQEVAALNAVIDGQEARSTKGSTFRVSNSWLNQTLTAEIFAVINFTRSDHYLRPLLTYTFSDHLKGFLGGDIYHGSGNTQYGLLQPTSGAFAELRYGF